MRRSGLLPLLREPGEGGLVQQWRVCAQLRIQRALDDLFRDVSGPRPQIGRAMFAFSPGRLVRVEQVLSSACERLPAVCVAFGRKQDRCKLDSGLMPSVKSRSDEFPEGVRKRRSWSDKSLPRLLVITDNGRGESIGLTVRCLLSDRSASEAVLAVRKRQVLRRVISGAASRHIHHTEVRMMC